jgi:hypothetical protein
MIVRSESVLALLPPFIAMTWVIADATMEPAAADRDFAAAASAVHIVSANETSLAVETKPSGASVTICSPDGTVAAGIASADYAQVTLQRLCQAGQKFTSGLPKT